MRLRFPAFLRIDPRASCRNFSGPGRAAVRKSIPFRAARLRRRRDTFSPSAATRTSRPSRASRPRFWRRASRRSCPRPAGGRAGDSADCASAPRNHPRGWTNQSPSAGSSSSCATNPARASSRAACQSRDRAILKEDWDRLAARQFDEIGFGHDFSLKDGECTAKILVSAIQDRLYTARFHCRMFPGIRGSMEMGRRFAHNANSNPQPPGRHENTRHPETEPFAGGSRRFETLQSGVCPKSLSGLAQGTPAVSGTKSSSRTKPTCWTR